MIFLRWRYHIEVYAWFTSVVPKMLTAWTIPGLYVGYVHNYFNYLLSKQNRIGIKNLTPSSVLWLSNIVHFEPTNIGLNIWYKIGHSVYDGNMIGHRGFRCIHFSYIILYRHQNTVSLVLIRGNTIWLCWPLILLEWMYQSVGLFVWFAARPSSPKTTSSQNNRWLYKKCRQRLCCSFL